MSAFTERLVTVALDEVGTRESGSSNRGPRVDQYQQSTGWPKSDWGPWCAAFVCWCIREAARREDIHETSGFHFPATARAFEFEKWSLAQDNTTSTRKPCGRDIRRGDLIIWSFSHISIALGPPNSKGLLQTVDGNSNTRGSRTGGMVCTPIRHIDRVRSRIRFTI